MLGRKICRERWYDNTRSQQREHPKTEQEIVYPTRRSFDIGDEVLVKAEARFKDKDRFKGPYRVILKNTQPKIPTGRRPRRKDHPKERGETKAFF